jgi:hypothetical protein
MRTMPYLIKNTAGTWCVQRKVPERLQAAVAAARKSGKARQVYIKVSLGTQDRREANHRAKHALADIDRELKAAEARVQPAAAPVLRTHLNDAEIKRMAEYVYAKALASDERFRFGRDEFRRMEAQHIQLEGGSAEPWATPYDELPQHGLSPAILAENHQELVETLKDFRKYVALGDISAVEDHINEALDAFNIDVDQQSAAYSKLGIEVLRSYMRALQAIEKRDAGEPVPTPQLGAAALATGTLKEALEGWKKERERPDGTVHEYSRAIEMFIQLHGNLAVVDIKRSHARTFREALQEVPRFRKGPLLKATLPELSEYGRAHPTERKVAPGTVNKQLGAAQAIAGWAREGGLVPEDAPWSNPFEEMRLEEEQSQRAPFDARDLQTIFDAPLFVANKLPVGAKGDAGIWLPLLALFAGARQAEYAGLRASDVRNDEATGVSLMWFKRDTKAGRRLKTKTSERVLPVHPQLIRIGFLDYVAKRRKDGERAWLFPSVAPDQKGALRAWSKWWGRYLRNHMGISDTNKVYHSFRHGFQDALRRTTPDEELRDALTGRSSGKSVGRTYGAKAMLDRWGARALKKAIDRVSYPGLNLSRVRPIMTVERTRGAK